MLDPITMQWRSANSALLEGLPSISQQIRRSRLEDKKRLDEAIHHYQSAESENEQLRQRVAEGEARTRQMVADGEAKVHQMAAEGKSRTDQLFKALGEKDELQTQLALALKEVKDHAEKVYRLEEGGRMREMELKLENRDRNQEYERQIAQLQAEHRRTLDQSTARYEETLSTLKNDHLALTSTLENEHLAAISTLKKDHLAAISTVQDHLAGSRSRISDLENDHSASISTLKADHLSTISTLKEDHLAAISTVQSDLAGTRARISDLEAELRVTNEKLSMSPQGSSSENDLRRELETTQSSARKYKDLANLWKSRSEELHARLIGVAEGNVRLVERPMDGR
ncbi:hypothetical protein FFLO_06752 [Filobasidium floriforme]|uniref:Uncharacterized protein n=1 Tax=Filobasidium floriforme TaxID=5210 RepID=A0A8K0NMJ8_9TREE|nr:uncharacterized protein HD553DRAFT_346592 [Filobasidium floriforme]KAG7527619.1 hypothetical protein FFLO_06752 [Filobasidium floriforme]KAH8077645.1 hypothetical protein HD553DRAFT_346592 [Filobasidium floriforme]